MKKINELAIFFICSLVNILMYQADILKNFYLLNIGILNILILALRSKYSKKEIVLLEISLIISILGRNLKYFLFILIVILMSKISEKKIEKLIKIYYILGFFLLIMIVSLARLDIIDTKYFIYSATKIRNGLGFKNPNTPGIYYFLILTHYYFYNWEKLKKRDYVFGFLGYIYLYKFAMSRTTFIIGIFQLATIIFFKNKKKIKKNIKVIQLIPMFTFILTYLIAFFHNEKLNKLMTTRPITWKKNILENSNFINFLFGDFGEKNKYPLDNGLLAIQIDFGVIAIVIVIIILILGLKKVPTKYKERVNILILSYFLYSLSETMLISPNFGILIIYISSFCFKKIKTH